MLGMFGTLGLAVGAGAVPACSPWDSEPPVPPPPDPLEPLLASTRELAARYARVIADHPDLAGRLGPLHETHLAHEAALVEAIGRPELASPGPPSAGPPSAGPPSAGPPSTRPSESLPDQAVKALRRAEREGREQAAAACLAADPARAALLGSITAARRTHLEVLP